jgi:protein-tyrosine-phosphatase
VAPGPTDLFTGWVPAPTEPAFTVLLVCTGNICRSAMAERLGRAYLEEVLGDEAGAIRITSAGTRAVVGSAMHPDSALVLRGFGAEPGNFRARQLDEAIAGGADLILAMTRPHRRSVLHLAPRALGRTFVLREAADLLDLLDEEREFPGDNLADRARSLVRAMAEARSHRHGGPEDDVPDPIGCPLETHQEAGDLIVSALLPLLARLAALREGRPPQQAPTVSEPGPSDP